MVETFVKLTHENAIMPTKGSEDAAGWDLYAVDDYCIWPQETKMVETGVVFELPKGTFGGLFSRSGLSTKKSLILVNGVGVIDSDFRSSVKVPLFNVGNERQWIKKGDRIAQLVILPYANLVRLVLSDKLSETERGSGGFGSTGE